MRRSTLVAALVLAVLLTGGVAWGLVSLGGDGGSGIAVAPVSRATVTEVVEAPATVTPRATAEVTAAADGKVGRLAVRDGQRVEAGTLLMRLRSPRAHRALADAREADRAAASGEVALPSADLSEQQQAADEAAATAFANARDAARAVPDADARAQALAAVAQAEAQYEAASAQAAASVEQFNAGLSGLSSALSSLSRAQRVQTEAAVAAAQRTVDALTVRAPIAGVVSLGGSGGGGSGVPGGLLDQLPPGVADQAQGLAGESGSGGGSGSGAGDTAALAPGVPVSSGDVLASVTDTSGLGLVAEVDETDVLLVDRGVSAGVELDAVPGASYGGEVTSVDLSPTNSTGGGVTYRVRLSLSAGRTLEGDTAPRPRPGMSAIVDLRVRTAKDVVSVPASAVVRDLRRDSVWLVQDGVATRRTVSLGAQGQARVQVREGLETGDRVVVRGADEVREGQEVP